MWKIYDEDLWPGVGPHAGRGPKDFQRTDDRIWEDVCQELDRHSDIDAREVEVRVEDGEVTLSGTVEERIQKRLAEDLAMSVWGVLDVHNRLRVRRTERMA